MGRKTIIIIKTNTTSIIVLLAMVRQARHHRVKRWLDQEDVHLMSGRGYRARALAELANSSTFNYRGHVHELRRASAEASLLSDEEAGPAGHTPADGALQINAMSCRPCVIPVVVTSPVNVMSMQLCFFCLMQTLHEAITGNRLCHLGSKLQG